MGWGRDGYHSPKEIVKIIEECGISRIAISSTSTCMELYESILFEFKQLYKIFYQGEIRPILWLTPKMIENQNI